MSKIYTLFGMDVTRADELKDIIEAEAIFNEFLAGAITNGEALAKAYGRLISKHATKQDIGYAMGQLGIHIGRAEQNANDRAAFLKMLVGDESKE